MISYNQVVLLIGQVADQAQKQRLSAFVAKIKDKKILHNKLTISPNRTLLNISSDWLTTTKLRAKLLSSDVDASRIYLAVNNGNAYLMGIVTRAEAKQAIQLIQQTGSIKKIILALEYLD